MLVAMINKFWAVVAARYSTAWFTPSSEKLNFCEVYVEVALT